MDRLAYLNTEDTEKAQRPRRTSVNSVPSLRPLCLNLRQSKNSIYEAWKNKKNKSQNIIFNNNESLQN